MDSNEDLNKREEEIKNEMFKRFENEFVEHYSSWKKNLDNVNSIIDIYNSKKKADLKHMTYDQFCINMLSSFKRMLNESFKIEDILPDSIEKEEIKKFMKDKKNQKEYKEKLLNLKEAKYKGAKNKLSRIWQKNNFILLIKSTFSDIDIKEMISIKNNFLKTLKDT